MVPKTYSLKISLFISALFFSLFCTPCQADYTCDLQYSLSEYGNRNKCVSKGFRSEITYSCASSSCTSAVFTHCYGVLSPGEFKHDFNNPVLPFNLHNYRKSEDSYFVEAYDGPIPVGRFDGSPSALCRPPAPYAHCKVCSVHH
ncbi:hypothetical protein O181_033201 [Austropuccinia psidii MF-1]|uniref:Secreted protein n=1 Tax=Austropuccinia psidii MF-1 TaxID=1389203 RepID=A0A9Q3CYA1_9BASI|nr:hypothetical protein [Austropuccinia psidii MF-1]